MKTLIDSIIWLMSFLALPKSNLLSRFSTWLMICSLAVLLTQNFYLWSYRALDTTNFITSRVKDIKDNYAHLEVNRNIIGGYVVKWQIEEQSLFQAVYEVRPTKMTVTFGDHDDISGVIDLYSLKPTSVLGILEPTLGPASVHESFFNTMVKVAAKKYEMELSDSDKLAAKAEFKRFLQDSGLMDIKADMQKMTLYSGAMHFAMVVLFLVFLMTLISRYCFVVLFDGEQRLFNDGNLASQDKAVKVTACESFYHKMNNELPVFSLMGFLGTLLGLLQSNEAIQFIRTGSELEKSIRTAEMIAGFTFSMTTTVLGIVLTLLALYLCNATGNAELSFYQQSRKSASDGD